MKRFHPRRCSAKTFANLGVAMAEIEFSPNLDFSYRSNPDGTVDSICMSCYLTAATARSSDELRHGECLHLRACLGKNYAESVTPTGVRISPALADISGMHE